MTIWSDRVLVLKTERESFVSRTKEEGDRLEEARKGVSAAEKAQSIVQTVAQGIQREAHGRMASVVSRCMEAVFDEPYEFEIAFERKRGRTEARMTFERNGVEVDPMTASGGGVVDVAAFALRLACLVMFRPPKRRLLVLDEPFRFLSRDLRPRVKEFLLTIAEEMGVQFVVVTHDDVLTVGRVVEL